MKPKVNLTIFNIQDRYPNLSSGTDIKKNNFFRHIRYCVSISKNVISGVRINGEVTEEQLLISAPNMDYILVLHHKVSSDGQLLYRNI
jgi:hypothetical protein